MLDGYLVLEERNTELVSKHTSVPIAINIGFLLPSTARKLQQTHAWRQIVLDGLFHPVLIFPYSIYPCSSSVYPTQ